jgi:signal transduction histidine kinase
MKQAAALYASLLEKVVLAEDDAAAELQLAEAFELGRRFIRMDVPPDVLMLVHHQATVDFAKRHPEMRLDPIADRLARPLMEASMAYGLAFRDQTERRYQEMLDRRLEQSQKLEAVGTLAAGIAHDFNTLLGCIVGFAEMAGDSFAEGSDGKDNIRQVLAASYRARDLVAKLLTFARESSVTPVAVDLVALAEESLNLLRATYRPRLDFRLEAQAPYARVLAEPTQLQQVILNLCINAADAMGRIGTVDVRVSVSPRIDNPAFGTGAAAVLEVADRGMGMTPEIQQRIFDPFFTTKAPGKGSGLGLSVVYGIVAKLQGIIELTSRVAGADRGTTFRVVMPLLDPPAHG